MSIVRIHPKVNFANPDEKKRKDKIEEVSFRHEVLSELVSIPIQSKLFPFSEVFENPKIIESSSSHSGFLVSELIWSLNNGTLAIRWKQLSSSIRTARVFWVSNKRKKIESQWVSYQNSLVFPYKVKSGERIDIFFQVYDQNREPLILRDNSFSVLIGKRDKSLDNTEFHYLVDETQSALLQPYPSVPLIQIQEDLQVVSYLEKNQLRMLWKTYYLPLFSIEAYFIDYFEIKEDGIPRTPKRIILEEPQSSFYTFSQLKFSFPFK